MKKSVLVTGGAGFIGSHLVKKLLDKNWRVIVIDDFNDFYDPRLKRKNISGFLKNKDFKLEKGDITDKDFIHKVFRKYQPPYIVHLAARAGVRPSLKNPLLYTRVNILGTLNILEEAKNYPVKNFVFGSSSSIYGENKKIPFSESDETENQISPYAITKKAGEHICRMYSDLNKIPMTCLRFFTVYGPRQRPDLAIFKFMVNIIKNKPIELYGDGTTSRDYTYIDDIVDGAYRSLLKPFKFEIINLGNSRPVTLKKLITLVEKTLGKNARIKKLPRQPGDVERTYADIKKAKKLLGWKPKTNIEEGLKIMAGWVKQEIKYL